MRNLLSFLALVFVTTAVASGTPELPEHFGVTYGKIGSFDRRLSKTDAQILEEKRLQYPETVRHLLTHPRGRLVLNIKPYVFWKQVIDEPERIRDRKTVESKAVTRSFMVLPDREGASRMHDVTEGARLYARRIEENRKANEALGGAIAEGLERTFNYLEREKQQDEISRRIWEDHQKNIENFRAYARQVGQVAAEIRNRTTDLDASLPGQYLNFFEAINSFGAKGSLLSGPGPLDVKLFDSNDKRLERNHVRFKSAIAERRYTDAVEILEEFNYNSNPEASRFDLSGVTNDGVLKVEVIDKSLPTGPFSYARFKAPRGSDAGQLVRRAANWAQIVWAETKGFAESGDVQITAYLQALVNIRLADKYFSVGPDFVTERLEEVEQMLKMSLYGAYGLTRGTLKMAGGLVDLGITVSQFGFLLASDTSKAIDQAWDLLSRTPEIATALATSIAKYGEEFATSSRFKRTQMIGELLPELAATFLTTGASAGASSASKIAKSAESVEELVRKIGSKSFSLSAKEEKIAATLSQLMDNAAARGIEKRSSKMTTAIEAQLKAINYRWDLPVAESRELLKYADNEVLENFKRASDSLKGYVAPATDNYMARQAIYSGILRESAPAYLSQEDFLRIGARHHDINLRMAKVQGIPFEGTIYRGVPRVLPDGTILTEADVFVLSPKNKLANHRYTGPGQEALYASTSKEATDVYGVVFDEIDPKMKEKEMIVHSTPIKRDRVLDLTDDRNLNLLATAEQDLKRVYDPKLSSKSYAYEVPHIIGETAARYGFDAILVPPSVKSAGPHVKNIVILNGRTP